MNAPIASSSPSSASSSSSSSSSVSSSSNPDWAWLPKVPLYLVLNKLMLLSDMIRFSTVCTNWRSVTRDRFRQLRIRPIMFINRNLPMLLISSIDNNESIRNLFSINRGHIYDLQLEVSYNKRCCGSSHGWIITLNDASFKVTLRNPLYFGDTSKGIIHLPQFTAAIDVSNEIGEGLRVEYVICKAILSCDPILFPNDFAVMVIYGEMRKLAFWKPGAENWTYVTWALPQFFDVIYAKGRFLAVNSLGQLYSCEIADESYPPYNVSSASTPLLGLLGNCCRRYIVELPDETILQVIRTLKVCVCTNNGPILTTRFLIYKLMVDDAQYDWVSVESLEDGALFLGDNYSLYVSASQFHGCRPNSIYFTDDYHDSDAMLLNRYQLAGFCDIGVYSLDDGGMERYRHPILNKPDLPPPIWILPTI